MLKFQTYIKGFDYRTVLLPGVNTTHVQSVGSVDGDCSCDAGENITGDLRTENAKLADSGEPSRCDKITIIISAFAASTN